MSKPQMNPEWASNPKAAKEAAVGIGNRIGAIVKQELDGSKTILFGGKRMPCKTWFAAVSYVFSILCDQLPKEAPALVDDRTRIRQYIAANPRHRISEVAAALQVDALLVAKVMGDLRAEARIPVAEPWRGRSH